MLHLKNIVMIVCIVYLVIALAHSSTESESKDSKESGSKDSTESSKCHRLAIIGEKCDKKSGGEGVCQPQINCKGKCRLRCVDPPQCSNDTLPENPEFGTWETDGDRTYNTLSYLCCEEGYYVDGGYGCVQCQSNGSWSASTATCTPINCGLDSCTDYKLVPTVEGESFVGSTASVLCIGGFTPEYDNATCQSDGTWAIPDDACTVPPNTTTVVGPI